MVNKEQLIAYRDTLIQLPVIEAVMVSGGLIFDEETLTYYSKDFINGRVERLQTLIESGRYE